MLMKELIWVARAIPALKDAKAQIIDIVLFTDGGYFTGIDRDTGFMVTIGGLVAKSGYTIKLEHIPMYLNSKASREEE